MGTRQINMDERHKRFEAAIKAAMKENVADLTGEEMLAILSQVLGQLIALQDQRTMTPDRAMSIVAVNIEAGNASALAELDKPEGRS